MRPIDAVEQYQHEYMAAARHAFVMPDYRLPENPVAEWRMKERVREREKATHSTDRK